MMGRRRQTNKGLPPRMYLRGRTYYHAAYLGGKKVWTRLSTDYSIALAKWAQIEGNTSAGTLSEAIIRYRADVLPTLAAGSQPEYKRILGKLDDIFGAAPIGSVKRTDIAAYLDKRTAKVAANREVAVLSSVFACAIRWGLVEANPCLGVRKNKERSRKRHLEDWEIQALWCVADDQWKLIIELALTTGLRRGDLMNLTKDDATDGLRVTTGKTGARIEFEATPYLSALLAKIKLLRRRVREPKLFCTRNGYPYSVSGWNSAWRRIVDKSKVEDAHFHDLRARALTDAKNAQGRDYAQAMAGHADGSMTETYIRGREFTKVRPLK